MSPELEYVLTSLFWSAFFFGLGWGACKLYCTTFWKDHWHHG